MSYKVEELLDLMVTEGASDLHLQVGVPPSMRVDGKLYPVNGPDLKAKDTERLVDCLSTKEQKERLLACGDCDFAYDYKEKQRFRVSTLKSQGSLGAVLRHLPEKKLSLENIGFSDFIFDLLKRPRGLILLTGPTGSGKTTTLAAMLEWINQNRAGHIITVEDPIEYIFEHKSSIVTQKEVGEDVPDFAGSLRSVLRQDPDVIMVGEMRDHETMRAAITAAETGHLVFSTLHTTGAARTVDRIIDSFPPEAREEIRVKLSSSILAVISQTLVPLNDQAGRVAAFEIMIRTDAISALIRDNKSYRIYSEIQTGGKLGMITLDAHLKFLYTEGLIGAEEVLERCEYPEEMRTFLETMQV